MLQYQLGMISLDDVIRQDLSLLKVLPFATQREPQGLQSCSDV